MSGVDAVDVRCEGAGGEQRGDDAGQGEQCEAEPVADGGGNRGQRERGGGAGDGGGGGAGGGESAVAVGPLSRESSMGRSRVAVPWAAPSKPTAIHALQPPSER